MLYYTTHEPIQWMQIFIVIETLTFLCKGMYASPKIQLFRDSGHEIWEILHLKLVK